VWSLLSSSLLCDDTLLPLEPRSGMIP
jgi:hypothetical protein